MLILKNITKTYESEDFSVQALKGVSLAFRKNEFVAVLGQSGCGKTTMLNIVGGLDRYTSGDLVIGGVSTKHFHDRDWDNYRNHTVGFVFQSYNLIPHQTVLGNVELALTLSGISVKERRQRATEALCKVGLKDQINKRPNQLSGGQMQRVAIARALVNNPAVILADEPTGALDSETSVQVMDLLKEVAEDRLVIMVTHNPELAQEYATRIITLSDGLVTGDSNPYTEEAVLLEEQLQPSLFKEEPAAQPSQAQPAETDSQTQPAEPNAQAQKQSKLRKAKKQKKASMSFFTALSLSLRNLTTKKTRTILTSFAGSIGIIGIALILSLSSGFQNYINAVQRDTLSNYPVEITKQTADLAELMEGMKGTNDDTLETYPDSEEVTVRPGLSSIMNMMATATKVNDLKSFKAYLDKTVDYEKVSAVQYSYALQLNYFRKNGDTYQRLIDPIEMMMSMMMGDSSDSPMTVSFAVFSEMMNNRDLIKDQYDLVAGEWSNPTSPNELMLVVDKYNRISDYTLYYLGILDINDIYYEMLLGQGYSQQESLDYVRYMITGNPNWQPSSEELKNKKYTFEDFENMEFRVLQNSDFYADSDGDGKWESLSDKDVGVENALSLKITGMVRLKESVTSGSLGGTIVYNEALTQKLIQAQTQSGVIAAQMQQPTVNVFTGSLFDISDPAADTYESNLQKLGVADLSDPSAIYIYPTSFENKDYIVNLVKEYNAEKAKEEQITYTDYIGLMMSSITTIIDVISYVLIAFVSISLIVSSIMIGIITYISVLERTKEIGVLRSLGASKGDISNVFNAETLIVGFLSGIIGIGVTVLLNLPINLVINLFADIGTVAKLPVAGGIILILISMLLTFIAGLIPSRIAAKKDPVIALRSE
ncbi:MAG: ABC transporter ATP-binding protein/permease [Clostridia bacterium]|nr:ABC transporter ATP-binding protein/permease [Clostridia bacterium]